MNLLSRLRGTMAGFSKTPGSLLDGHLSLNEGETGDLRPLRVCRVLSHSRGEDGDWLYLLLSPPGTDPARKTQTVRNPVSDIECRLQAAGDFSLTLDLAPNGRAS